MYLKLTVAFLLSFASLQAQAQTTNWNNPDSAKNVSKPGVPWNITNPIGANHDTMMHTPFNGAFSDSTDYLYMYDFGFNVPATATIEGVEMILSRGACNGGSYFMDTVSLAYNGTYIGIDVTDSAGPASEIDTLGDSTDLWYAVLTPAMVNSTSFGVFYSSRSVGICTFGVFDCKLKIHYSLPTGVKGIATSRELSVYPNPASNEISINTGMDLQGVAFTITNAMGKVVSAGNITGARTYVNLQNLPAGIYCFRAQDAVIRFVKQ